MVMCLTVRINILTVRINIIDLRSLLHDLKMRYIEYIRTMYYKSTITLFANEYSFQTFDLLIGSQRSYFAACPVQKRAFLWIQ